MFEVTNGNADIPPNSCAPSAGTADFNSPDSSCSDAVSLDSLPSDAPPVSTQAYPHVSALLEVHALKDSAVTSRSFNETVPR